MFPTCEAPLLPTPWEEDQTEVNIRERSNRRKQHPVRRRPKHASRMTKMSRFPTALTSRRAVASWEGFALLTEAASKVRG